jgi:hypothetical protein
MQSLALENYGTEELSFDEQRGTEGGFWPVIVAAAAALLSSGCSREITKNLQHDPHGPKGICTNENHYHGAGGSY